MTQRKATALYSGAFSDPVFQSQRAFRALMDGMARPGTVHSLGVSPVDPPSPLGAGAGAVALCLCDAETPVWMTAALMQSDVPAWLAFHAGAPMTQDKAQARFAFVETGGVLPGLAQFAHGSAEYPDRSTTLVVELPALDGGPFLVASGPGIKDATTIAPAGLPMPFTALWAENAALFPCGVDLVLVAGTDILCLPRTTKLKEA